MWCENCKWLSLIAIDWKKKKNNPTSQQKRRAHRFYSQIKSIESHWRHWFENNCAFITSSFNDNCIEYDRIVTNTIGKFTCSFCTLRQIACFFPRLAIWVFLSLSHSIGLFGAHLLLFFITNSVNPSSEQLDSHVNERGLIWYRPHTYRLTAFTGIPFTKQPNQIENNQSRQQQQSKLIKIEKSAENYLALWNSM